MGKNDGAIALNLLALIIGVIMLLTGALALIGVTLNLFIPSNLWVGAAVVLIVGANLSKLM